MTTKTASTGTEPTPKTNEPADNGTCHECGALAINVQGLLDCPECGF